MGFGKEKQDHPSDWTKQPHDAPRGLNLPFIDPTCKRQGVERTTKEFTVPASLVELLNKLAQSSNTTLLTVFMAGFKSVLHRYTHDEDIIVATHVGDFSKRCKVLPLRTDLSGNPTCRQLLDRVSQVIRSATTNLHRHASLNNIQETINNNSDSKTAPLFSYFLAIESSPGTANQPLEIGARLSTPIQADLSLLLRLDERLAKCTVAYNSELLGEWFIEQFYRHFLIVLTEFCKDFEQRIGTLLLLTLIENKLLREKWKGDSRDYPIDNKLQIIFEEQVERIPDAIALTYYDVADSTTSLSYLELNMRANEVAHELVRLGVGRDISVGVYLARSPHAIVALLAILKAGAVYVPLDISYPEEHLRIILTETQALVLLTTEDLLERGSKFGIRTVCIESVEQRVTAKSRKNPSNNTSTDDIALIMYTSGSTGRPKGVKHRQRQLVNRFYWMWESYPFIDGDVACQRSSLCVMPSMWELMGGLLKGHQTLIIPNAVVKNPPQFLQALAHGKVSYVTLVPSLLRLMLNYRREAESLRDTLRVVTIGGELLPVELYNWFREVFPTVILVEDYGCTEVNTILHYALTSNDRDLTERPGGRPITNLEVYVLDKKRQLVPPGVQGELYVGGGSISTGYLGLPELTAEKFIPHLFSQETSARLYKTGDLAYYLPDGTIKLIGRADDLVKINGMRIELTGIEALLSQHEYVKECAVVPKNLKGGAKQLQAFVVKQEGTSPTKADLRHFLESKLPPFMVPARYSFLESLPRTPNGKINRKALVDYKQRIKVDSFPKRSHNESELVLELRGILAELLEVSPSEIDEGQEFYLLGLDSVLSVEFVMKLSAMYEKEFSVTTMYDYSTIQSLAEYLLAELQQPPDEDVISPHDRAETVGAVRGKAERVASAPKSLSHRNASRQEYSSDDIAIIGMSGRFPKAHNLVSFWQNLAIGVNAVTEVPGERWDAEAYYDPDLHKPFKSVSKWGAFLDNIDKFEPLFFNISPAEARLMDPQHRLSLEESWKALEDSGYSPNFLNDKVVGVFVGAKKGDYANHFDKERPDLKYTLLGNDLAMLASRISYHMNLRGPCLTVDTACSSSLVAVHLACQSIRLGESDIALAGGVCLVTSPEFYVATSKLGILSQAGNCRAFDNNADGFVQGEGVAFVVLKSLKKALQDGDNVYGIIRASSMNHDGKTNGISAPSALSQTSLQANLYRERGIDPSCISYVEAHGTGTKIGDPIEVRALTESFRQFTQKKQFCAIGSLKPNVGHLTAAAGIAGLVKLLLCFKHKALPPSINYDTPNEHINFEESPFYVNTTLREWSPLEGTTRMAAINSFGLGGTNVHCVLEEPLERKLPEECSQPCYLVPISAKSVDSLRQRLHDLSDWIESEGQHHSIRDVSYTLLVGRKFFPICCVYVASDMDSLSSQITQTLRDGGLSTQFMNRQNGLPRLDPLMEELANYLVFALSTSTINDKEYFKKFRFLAELIAKGFRFDGSVLFRAEKGYRIPLPTYPFLRESYWFEVPLHQDQPLLNAANKGSGAERVEVTLNDEVHLTLVDTTEEPRKATELEVFLQKTFSRLLGTDGLPSEVRLEEYGFDSLSALTLKYELEKHLLCTVPMALIAQGATISDMAKNIHAHTLGKLNGTNPNGVTDNLNPTLLNGELQLSKLTTSELDALFDLLTEDSYYATELTRVV